MKVAIDGYTLAIAEGTGVTQYALELSQALATAQHQVFPIYGLNSVGRIAGLMWPRFIQSLILRGEARSYDFARWGMYSALYFLNYMAGIPVRAQQIVPDERIDISSISERLPAFTKLYNVPSVYRSAQAYLYFFAHPLRISLNEKIDIWHSTIPLPVKVAGAKHVVTAHDIIPIVVPHSTAVNLRHYRRILSQSFKSADMIFAVSEHTKKDLLANFDIPERKVFVTYQSVEIPKRITELKPHEIASFLNKAFGLNYGNYFLFYGAVEPKKNVARILEAICTAKTKMPIVIAGRTGWLDSDVSPFLTHLQSNNNKSIVRIGYLPFNQLMFLLRGARALVFPSLYEGFGIPLLEAMLIGCPVITSKSTALVEVCGDAALYVNPMNSNEIAELLDVLAVDDDLTADLTDRGKAQAAYFSRNRYVARLEEGYALARQA